MLFKYPMHSQQGEDSWVVVDGFDEINWQEGWFTAVDNGNKEATVWTFGFSEKKPEDCDEDEIMGITTPEDIYVPSEWYQAIIERKARGITALHVTLRRNKDPVRIMIVSNAYLLNDDGRTVERLYPKIPV
jgi:hypothetical protein